MTTAQRIGAGIYVDAANIQINGGYGMQYDVLREFGCHDSGDPVRLNTYVTYDADRAEQDPGYRVRTNRYYSTLRGFGFKVIVKNYRWYTDEEGRRYAKANADLEMAVDCLLQSDNLDRVLLATGDGDFVQVVRALQNKGCRVEVLGFDNVSADLRREADVFVSGYLIPDLLPPETESGEAWGHVGSRVRGTCYHYNAESGFGFFRFLNGLSGNLWITDSRKPSSPYSSVYFSGSDLPNTANKGLLPSHDTIFEFDLEQSRRREDGLQAAEIGVTASYDSRL